MKQYLLLIPTLLIASLYLSSCEDSSNADAAFQNLSPAGITGVQTKNVEEFCCWGAGTQISFVSSTSVYDHWTITIAESQGAMQSISTDHLHWRGKITYEEKNKQCKEMVYLDSLMFDIATSEAGWNEGTFRISSTQYEKGYSPGAYTTSTFYVKPENGNYNTLNVSDQNHAYIFRFKTRSTDDINSWKIDQMPQGWMNSNGKISMLIIPILYSMFQ